MLKYISFFFSLIACICVPAPVRAERVPAIVYKDCAYLFGKPEPIVTVDMGEVQAAPNGRYLQFIHNTPTKETFDDIVAEPSAKMPAVILSLYDARYRRMIPLWKAQDDENRMQPETYPFSP